eukprot:TRINITY_DN931_c0_g1_i2.p1 TRINITY_DN931_c0_g1~~TRINITY_DN931_c0_g1_i2.p1  ORF type:complete len:411 (+),score=55.70 TRINITY_DN931_c0_g1_i2:66-1298(+)
MALLFIWAAMVYVSVAQTHDCTVTDSTGYVYDFTSLRKTGSTDWIGKSLFGNTFFYFNFCANTVSTNCIQRSSPAYRKSISTCTSLGDLTSYKWTPPVNEGDDILLEYSNGQTVVKYSIYCGPSEPSQATVIDNTSEVSINFPTPLACKSAGATGSRSRSRAKTRTRTKSRSRAKTRSRSRTRSRSKGKTRSRTSRKTVSASKTITRSPTITLSRTPWPAEPFRGVYEILSKSGDLDCTNRIPLAYNVTTYPDIGNTMPMEMSADLPFESLIGEIELTKPKLSNLEGIFEVTSVSMNCTGDASNQVLSAKGSSTIISMTCSTTSQSKCFAKILCQDCDKATEIESSNEVVLGVGITITVVSTLAAVALIIRYRPQSSSKGAIRSTTHSYLPSYSSSSSRSKDQYGSFQNL